jgi:hypothetical protein
MSAQKHIEKKSQNGTDFMGTNIGNLGWGLKYFVLIRLYVCS